MRIFRTKNDIRSNICNGIKHSLFYIYRITVKSINHNAFYLYYLHIKDRFY